MTKGLSSQLFLDFQRVVITCCISHVTLTLIA
jgi:hypothetical protein